MYKVVIVDDEPVIVRGLKQIIDWGKLNCEVVGTAESGQEGMRLIQECRPDILFSDINMPGLDGLNMIAAIKSEFERMQITILTGYRDFDYAQRAIRLGVTRFLLKPSKIDEIEEAIRVMTEKLREQEEEEKLREEVSQIASEAGAGAGAEDAEADPKRTQEPEGASKGLNGGSAEEENPASSFIVKNALEYIEENYQQKLKLSDVAEKTYVSQWHLSKLLNRHTGQNFSEILNNVRIEKAKYLLKDPSLRIGDVAEAVGFLDIAHFSRVFKKQVGISANEYRNTILGK